MGRCFITSTSLALQLFLLGLVKLNLNIISVETDLGRRMRVAAMVNVDAYPFLVFSHLTCYLDDAGIGVCCLHWAA